MAVKASAPFTRSDLILHLNRRKIATRLLFAGNLIRQPAYQQASFRKVEPLMHTETIMNTVFWVGVYPGLTREMLGFVAETIDDFINRKQDTGE